MLSRRAFLLRVVPAVTGLVAPSGLIACDLGQRGGSTAPEVTFGEPVSVTFWHTQTGPHEQALAEMATKFNATNEKGITLQCEYQGSYTQVFQKVMAAIQAGSPPDVAVANEGMVAEYTKANAVVDLDDYALRGPQAYRKESLDDIFPACIESNRYDAFNGKLLSFPFAKSLAVQYHNEDVLRAATHTKFAGLTFDEFKRQVAASTKKDSGGRPIVWGHHIRVDASYVGAFIYANGGELLTKDKAKVRFNEAPAVEVLEMWAGLVRQGLAYTTQGYEYQADFGSGRVASLHDSSASRTFLKQEAQDKFGWGIGMIPQREPRKPATLMFGGNVTVFRTTAQRQAAAWEWIKFFTDRDQTVAWAIQSGSMPTRRSAAEHPELTAHWEHEPQAKQAFELTRYARPEPNIPAWQDIRSFLAEALTAVITHKMTAKGALDIAAVQANRLIQEKR